MTIHRITPAQLQVRLGQPSRPVLLDVRRLSALRRQPLGIAGAVPVLLDEPDPLLPELPRETAIAVYCLCSGEASSTRVASWLDAAGYGNVSVLEGGLPGWQAAGLPVVPVAEGARASIRSWRRRSDLARSDSLAGKSLIAERAFLAGVTLPARREMAVLFVDMVDSTRLLFVHPPERVLSLVQQFMEIVVEIAVQHCGDVHDFEGDGAMLYFAGPGESVPAAFNLRAALAARRHCEPQLPHARFALDTGPLVVGHVGSTERRALAFIGPSVNTAARILKLAPPDGIVATQAVVTHAERTDPDLAGRFVGLEERQRLKGIEEPVTVYLAASKGNVS